VKWYLNVTSLIVQDFDAFRLVLGVAFVNWYLNVPYL
jgi:hypothetical protein